MKPSLLLAKVGTHPELTGIVSRLRTLLPDVNLLGIEVEGTAKVEGLQYVAHEMDLILGEFDDWWSRHLFLEPSFYVDIIPHESRLLRLAQRAIDSDITQGKHQKFPMDSPHKSFDGRRQLVIRQVAFWNWVLDEHCVTGVVSQNLPHNFWDSVLHVVAEVRNIPYLTFHEVRPFLGSMYIYESPSQMGDLTFGKSLLDRVRKDDEMIGDSVNRLAAMLDQVSVNSASHSANVSKKAKKTTKINVSQLFSIRNIPSTVQRLSKTVIRRARVRLTSRQVRKFYWVGDLPKRYFFLELQPPSNATSLTKAFMYADQRELVAHISHNLPHDCALIVLESTRDHMSQKPRDTRLLRQIAALPSVVLVGPSENVVDLVENSVGLIEVGYSSRVLNALHREIPVVILGATHLPSLPGVHKVAAQDNLSDVLSDVIARPMDKTFPMSKHLLDWATETQLSTLEGFLSSFPKDLHDKNEYHRRIVNNCSKLIAHWYLSRQSS